MRPFGLFCVKGWELKYIGASGSLEGERLKETAAQLVREFSAAKKRLGSQQGTEIDIDSERILLEIYSGLDPVEIQLYRSYFHGFPQ